MKKELFFVFLLSTTVWAQVTDSQVADSQTTDTQVTDSQTTNVQTTDSQVTDSQTTDTQVTDSQVTDTQVTDSQVTDSQVTDSQVTDSQVTDSQVTDSQVTDSQVTDSQVTDSQTTDTQVTDSQTTNVQTTDSQVTDTLATDSEVADSQIEVVDGKEVVSSELTKSSMMYLLSSKIGMEDKEKELGQWLETSKKWHEEGRYADSVKLSQSLQIAVPRLELIRQLRVLEGNIYAYEKMSLKDESGKIALARGVVDEVHRIFSKDGTASKHKEVQQAIKTASLDVASALEKGSDGKKTVINSEGLEISEAKEGEYVVKLIPDRRESLWRISGYDFIYNDPWKWRKIYEANKKTIKDPDLIYPGQKLIIPPMGKDEIKSTPSKEEIKEKSIKKSKGKKSKGKGGKDLSKGSKKMDSKTVSEAQEISGEGNSENTKTSGNPTGTENTETQTKLVGESNL